MCFQQLENSRYLKTRIIIKSCDLICYIFFIGIFFIYISYDMFKKILYFIIDLNINDFLTDIVIIY